MNTSLKFKLLYVTFGAVLATSSASAKVYLNSMCTMAADSTARTIEGDKNKDKKYPLASISKLATSLWAVEKLGAYYRYKTKLHVEKVGNDTYDVHIEGGRDPIFGKNAAYFLISELNSKNIDIKKIETLSFDENFLIQWTVEERASISGRTTYFATIEEQVEAVRKSLVSDFASPIIMSSYNQLAKKATEIGVTMEKQPTLSVRRVEFKSKNDFKKSQTSTTLVYQSAPLHTILKNMNNRSNNYIADVLYWNLGGTEEFTNYVNKAMSLTTDQIEFKIGSGNNADYLYGGSEVYNKATCESMIKIVYRLNSLLEKEGLNLSNVMAVAATDSESTMAGYRGNMERATIAKTGTVNRAKTLAGTVSTKKGVIYFAVLMHMDQLMEQNSGAAEIKKQVNSLITTNGGAKKIEYVELLPLAFDEESKVVSVAVANSKLPVRKP